MHGLPDRLMHWQLIVLVQVGLLLRKYLAPHARSVIAITHIKMQ